MTSFKRKNLAGGFVELSRSIEPDNTQWLPVEFGILVFQKDYGKKGYFFRLYDLESNTKSNDFVWELEMYTPFKYHQLNDSFHYIPDDGYYIGFNFTVPEQAKKFLQVVTQTQKARDDLYKNKKVIKLKKTESQVSIPSQESKIKKRAFSIKNTIVESKLFSNFFGLKNRDKDKSKVMNSKSNMILSDKKSKIDIKENKKEEKIAPKKTAPTGSNDLKNKISTQSSKPVKQTENTIVSPVKKASPPPPPPALGNIPPPPPPLLKIDSAPAPPPPPPPPSFASSPPLSSPPPPPPPIDGPKLPGFLNDISSFNSAKLKKTETVDKSVLNYQKTEKKEVTPATSNNNNKKEVLIAEPVDPNEALLSSIRQFKGFNKKTDDGKKNDEKKLPLKPKSLELKDQLKDILASRQPFLQQSSDESDSDVEW